MSSNRRNFLMSGPAALFAYEGFAKLAEAQGGSAKSSLEVTDFWSRGMGVPPTKLLGGSELNSRGGHATNMGSGTDFAREPLFLYYNADDKVLMPATEIPGTMLPSSGDAKVDFQLVRMRLNADDDKVFQNFTSGGIYLDMSQQGQAGSSSSSSSSPWYTSLATSVFSAFFPGKPAASGKSTTTAKKSGGLNFLPDQAAANTTAGGAPAATVPLQQPKQAQSIVLTGGMGKTAFSAFAKGRKKTAFGSFLDAVLSLAQTASPYIPMLNLPIVGSGTLTEIRTLVGNLQNHGGDQQAILQSPPLDLAASAEALKQLDSALRLRAGQYIAIPQEHAAALKPQMANLKILNGFLVPKEATEMDVYTTVPTTAQTVSYLSLSVGVTPSTSKKG